VIALVTKIAGRSPNKPMQRAGMDGLRGRGRLSMVFVSSLPHPRAVMSVAGS
jgi:hypothetical protein